MHKQSASIAAAIGIIGVGLSLISPTLAHADDVFAICPDGHSGIATTVTSCPFAMNVRRAYLTQYGPIVVAYSPVTGLTYNMQCQSGFIATLNNGLTRDSVRCVGGNNAVVILF